MDMSNTIWMPGVYGSPVVPEEKYLPMMIGQERDVRIVTFKHDFNDDHTQYYMKSYPESDHGKLMGLVVDDV